MVSPRRCVTRANNERGVSAEGGETDRQARERRRKRKRETEREEIRADEGKREVGGGSLREGREGKSTGRERETRKRGTAR